MQAHLCIPTCQESGVCLATQSRFAIGMALVLAILCACSGANLPSSRPPSPTNQYVARMGDQAGVVRVDRAGPKQAFSASRAVLDNGHQVRGFRIAGKRDYWFPEGTKLSRYQHFVIARSYGRTFVFEQSDIRIVENEFNRLVTADGLSTEAGVPVASSLAAKHLKHSRPEDSCPDCIQLRPSSTTASNSNKRNAQYIVQPVCDSEDPFTCQTCGADFFTITCCDVATSDCSAGGYYDVSGDWIPDACAGYLYDADYYAECVAFNNGVGYDIVSRMNVFRTPGVQHYYYYADSNTVMHVRNPGTANVVLTYNYSFSDLFTGYASGSGLPMSPLSAVLSDWCWALNLTSPFSSSTWWVNDASGKQVGAWSATLAETHAVTYSGGCPPN